MARRIFVHIGAPKSGTTYLQDRLAANREELGAHGIVYPETRSGDHFEPALDLIERPWGGELAHARGQWRGLAEAVERASGDAVVSHEILAAATAEQVSRALASFGDAEVHVVMTVRDLARQLPAEWQEEVKHRRVSGFAQFAARVVEAPRTGADLWFWRVQSVPDVLTRWGNGLTPDRVHIVTVPQAGEDPALLWERFCSVIGIDPALVTVPSEPANASLGIAEIAVLRRLNRRLRRAKVSRETYVQLVRETIVREAFAGREGAEPPILPVSLRPFAEEVCEEWREWIHGAGVDVVGDLDDLRPRWFEGTPRDPDRPPATAVASAAIEALAAVLIDLDRRTTDEERRRTGLRLGRILRS
jgi:hypothetical protein